MRWIVGDLQGCARELEDLLRAIHFDAGRDQLWAAGDLVNRGPDSLATLRLWRELGGLGVIGNHEVYTLCARSGRWPRKHDTLDELYAAPDAEELLASLRALPAMALLPAADGARDVWLVHAGVHPQWRDLGEAAARLDAREHDDDWLTSDELSFVTRVRCCTATGERNRFDRLPEDCPPPFQAWDAFYDGDAIIVHGHWARRGHYRGAKTIGLDSGCVYGGPLTAWCVEEDRVVQVPSRKS
ncbi:Bis(5'-nucleosyl)-tetraphosphatase, symmetrical [Enhygromyxa salina]|uniref:Bis(5'-nucleosyl)-tetraphosphatase, symmetrical n=1 Tax=Enhygromyxa salina TaxID=215803 RepID=A0A2S9XCA0_9BACT|nr:metallophosphoesterase [Enhygromyxa salina]PRP90482.1 Bis(5'-nucleosyl)-tetraphosphatase, symmetrical [Enhygromyxa salina]